MVYGRDYPTAFKIQTVHVISAKRSNSWLSRRSLKLDIKGAIFKGSCLSGTVKKTALRGQRSMGQGRGTEGVQDLGAYVKGTRYSGQYCRGNIRVEFKGPKPRGLRSKG